MQQALLDQIGLDCLFNGIALFGQSRRQCLDPNRTTTVILGNTAQEAPVHGIEAQFIDVEAT